MTGPLEKALKRVEALSEMKQDAIAAQILESLNDEEAWHRNFDANREKFRALAEEAMAEHGRGETRPIKYLFGVH